MDIKLNYIERGTGFPLILLHGNGENCGYFEHQIEYFSAKYRVFAIDTRGHGKSPRGGTPFTIVQFAQDLNEFMIEHEIEKAHILGFSDGGNIALTFALRHPEKIEKLILNGANLNTSGVRPVIQAPIVIGYKLASMFAKKSENARKNAEMMSLMVNEPDIKPSELAGLTVPALVIAGTRDMIKRSHTQLIAESLPNAKLVFIDGDHFIANKKAEEFNRVVNEFLEQA